MKIQVLNKQGTKVKDLNIKDEVFGIEPHKEAIYLVVKAQRAAMRQGTAKTKNRSEVRGGGRKPYRQKGTGRARQGSIRAPQYPGGGVVFGPTPRKYNQKVNKKVANLAMRSALSHHKQNKSLIVLDNLEIDKIKTKEFAKLLNNIKANNKVLILPNTLNDNLVLSARNIPNVSLEKANHSSVYDILNANTLVLTVDSIKYFEEVLI